MKVSIDHPTDLVNFSLVTVGKVELAFSYKTIIGFRVDSVGPWITRPNEWGPTTGKHLGWLGRSPRKVETETADRFLDELETQLAYLGTTTETETENGSL